jgi:CotS family spore coat protein
VKDRPDRPDRANAGKPAAGFTIWVPPGVVPIVSSGVRTVPYGGQPESRAGAVPGPVEPGFPRGRRERQPDPAPSDRLSPARVVKPVAVAGTGWRVPERWSNLPPTAPETDTPGDADPMSVSPEMEAAAHKAATYWDMTMSAMQVMATKPEKGGAIWRIETNRGRRSLKLLHRPPPRSLFSIGLQDYLVKQGARVPALIPAKNRQLSVELDGKLWIVTDWIEPLTPAGKDLAGAQALCYGLGEFHRHSRGYLPPAGAEQASRLHRWPKTYQKMLTKIGWFREIARAYAETPAAQSVLSMVDLFEQQARDAIARLEGSAYASLVARGGPAWGVVHQDYGWSNGQIGAGGVWIIDLDGVAYDLPVRDLRKLITSTMDDTGVWDPAWMRGMIDAYTQAHPIDPELYQILLIDMSLPNEFYKHVKTDVTKNYT